MDAESRKYVLIVDDEEAIIDTIVRRILTHHTQKFEPLVAVNGYEALDYMKDKRKDILAVILDIRMRDMDGMAVCRKATAEAALKSIPIIVSSGYLDEDDRAELAEIGIQYFLDKPYKIEDLFALLETIQKQAG